MPWKLPETVYSDAITSQNPWWSLGHVPAELAKPVPRHLGQFLATALQRDRIRYQLILGPRRVGKTTAMYQTVERLLSNGIPQQRIAWLTLNVPYLMEHPLDVWVRILLGLAEVNADNPLYLFLDEVNYAERWDLWLKTFYDEKLPIRIAATSSSTAALRDRQFESGVGRWEEQFIAPCLFSEYLDLVGTSTPVQVEEGLKSSLNNATMLGIEPTTVANHRRRYLLVGGFPELILNPIPDDEPSEILRSQQVLRSDAIQRAVGMDIPQVFNVNEPIKLERLLYILAGQIGGIVKPNTLAADLGLTAPTVHQYLNYLEKAFLVMLLPNYSSNEESVQRRGRKMFFMDGAVRNAALFRGIAPLSDPTEMGVLFENAVAAHLKALADQLGVRLFHWRKGKDEVDFIFDHPTDPVAVEVTKSIGHSTSGLQALMARYPRFKGSCYIVSSSSAVAPADSESDQVGRIPFDQFLLIVGALAQNAMDARLGL